jgi:hypothetical protein
MLTTRLVDELSWIKPEMLKLIDACLLNPTCAARVLVCFLVAQPASVMLSWVNLTCAG